MEARAPVSRVVRARARRGAGAVGVGRRAFRDRSWRFARERREARVCGEGGGVEWSLVRVAWRSVVDMVGGGGWG